MQNLLPQQEKINLKKGYDRRLLVVYSFMVFFAFLISSAVFIPLYSLADSKALDIGKKIDLNSAAKKEQEATLLLPEQINLKSKTVLSFKGVSSVSKRISTISDVVGAGISLNNISYRKVEKGQNQVQILVSGVAKSRESLLSFEKSLQAIKFVKDIVVPVGSFAKDNDLPFTITLTLI